MRRAAALAVRRVIEERLGDDLAAPADDLPKRVLPFDDDVRAHTSPIGRAARGLRVFDAGSKTDHHDRYAL